MSDPLSITRIEAVNILKFDRFELDKPGKLTLVRGANDQGKTTVLRLLSLCVRGADDPSTVIHDGAARGAVQLLLSNGYSLRRSFTEKGQYVDLLDERGHKVPNPQTEINKIVGENRDFNPLAWLDLATSDSVPERARAIQVLLRAIDVRLTAAEFTQVTGQQPPESIDFGSHGLLVLDALRAHFAEDRKLQNRIANQRRAAAAEARTSLPAERPVITAERRAALEDARAAGRTASTNIEARKLAATNYQASCDRIEEAKQRERDEIDRANRDVAEFEAEIERIRGKIQSRQAAQAQASARIEQLDRDLTTLANSAPPTDAEISDANVIIRHANALAQAISADEKLLVRFGEVDRLEDEANSAAATASIVDATIKMLDGELRDSLMRKAALPVDSLEIRDDRIFVGDHDIQYCAESQQIRIALAIARALKPTLRVIVLDGMERIDARTFVDVFLPEIHGDGFTYFATEVDKAGGPLTIITFGETADAVVQQKDVA